MERKDVETKLKWKIEDLFSDEDAWQKEYNSLENSIDFKGFIGKLGDKKHFLEFNKISDEVENRLDKLYVYTWSIGIKRFI